MEFISKLREQAILAVDFNDDDQNTEFFINTVRECKIEINTLENRIIKNI